MRISRRTAAVVMIAVVVSAGVSGCAPTGSDPEDSAVLRSGLASSVERAQDAVWAFRGQLIADPEGSIPDVWGLGDARPSFDHPTEPLPSTSFRLIGVKDSDESTDLTVMVGAAETRPGLWTYSQVFGMTCFTLSLLKDLPRLDTVGSDCTDVDGVDRTELLSTAFGSEGAITLPFDQLGARSTVDASTYRLPCRCSSGGDCDCPGG